MIFQYHGKISIALGPRKHFPSISDRQEARPLWGVPVQAGMCEMAVASAISSSTGSTEVAMDVAGCRSMKLIYGHMALPKSVHQESSGLSSCSIQPPKNGFGGIPHFDTNRHTYRLNYFDVFSVWNYDNHGVYHAIRFLHLSFETSVQISNVLPLRSMKCAPGIPWKGSTPLDDVLWSH